MKEPTLAGMLAAALRRQLRRQELAAALRRMADELEQIDAPPADEAPVYAKEEA